MAEEFHRRLAVVLAADVVGYSRLMGEDETGTLTALKAHREAVVEPRITAHEGRIIKLIGDGLLAEFASAVEAVSCAAEIQREMAEWNVDIPESRRLRLRIGLNLGDIIVEDDDLYGDGINIAARLEELAVPGGIYVARNVYEQVKNKLDVEFHDLGEQQLKNIVEPIRVFSVLVDGKETPIPEQVRKRHKVTFGQLAGSVFAIVLLVAGGLALWLKPWVPDVEPAAVERMASALPDKPSIAVLPFKNLSDDPEQAYFVDGITGDLVTDLSKFPALRVASRSSTAAYQAKPVDVRRVSQDLGVQYIVEGSVEKTADRVRVSAQLTEAATGTQLWAQRFDRELVDLFAVRDEIRTAIVSALTGYTGPLNKAEQQRAIRKSPDRLTARDFYYRAYVEFSKFDKDANAQARNLLEESIALDPDDVGAHWLLAWVHWRDFWVFGAENGEESLDTALEEARKSVELDRADYRGHWVLGAVLRLRGDSESAMAEYERAFDLNPNDPDMLADWGEFLSYRGRPEKAVAQLERAMVLNPSYPDWYVSVLGRAYYNSRQYESAILLSKRPVKARIGALEVIAASYAQLDRIDDAKTEVERLLEIEPDHSIAAFLTENRSLEKQSLQHFLEGLRKAGLPEN